MRRPGFYTIGIVVAALDVLTQLLLLGFGFVLLATPNALSHGLDLGTSPTWHSLLFALPLAMLAYTGLETVANMAEEARRPGVDLPRSVFAAIAVVVVVYVAIAYIGLSAFPVENGQTALGTTWLKAPLIGIAEALHGHLASWLVAAIRGVRRRVRRADPARERRDRALGRRAPRLLARRARHAAASVRAARPAHAHRSRVDRGGRGHVASRCSWSSTRPRTTP